MLQRIAAPARHALGRAALAAKAPAVDAEQERRRLAKEIDRLVRDDAEARLPEGAQPVAGEKVFQGEIGGTGYDPTEQADGEWAHKGRVTDF